MKKTDIVHPPKPKNHNLDSFPLSELEQTFSYASYERRISKNKVKQICQAIIQNNFYDNVIRASQEDGKRQYDIKDGMHRIEALKLARDVYGVSHYDLILLLYSNDVRWS